MLETPKFVLCVDDDEDDRLIVCEAIQGIDASLLVVHAVDGLEALDLLGRAKQDQNLPCLIILDINMPRMNGRETLAVIKKDEELHKLPVVVFSTSNSHTDRIYCNQFGVELVTKPTSIVSISREIHRLLYPCVED